MPNIETYVIRLLPGSDLKNSIEEFRNDKQINSGWIVSCIGSLTSWSIRFANMKDYSAGTGFFEICQLSGTLTEDGNHLHISIADGEGKMTGGHLGEGCIVYTTCEIIIQASSELKFSRVTDDLTGFKELKIEGREL